MPLVISGSADHGSTLNHIKDGGDFNSRTAAAQLHFGIREHACAASSTDWPTTESSSERRDFLVFSDYGRPSIVSLRFPNFR
jgi:transketolase